MLLARLIRIPQVDPGFVSVWLLPLLPWGGKLSRMLQESGRPLAEVGVTVVFGEPWRSGACRIDISCDLPSKAGSQGRTVTPQAVEVRVEFASGGRTGQPPAIGQEQ
jgi:hypothetical protein